MSLDVFYCTDHDGHWVGVASVVVAGSEVEARGLLRRAIHERGLDDTKPFTLTKIRTDKPGAFVLQNGDY